MNEIKFHEERKTAIGGSDMSDLFELEEEGGCQKRLYFEKTGVVPDYDRPLWLNNAAKRGHKLESIIGEEYSEQTGRVVIPMGDEFIRHPDYPFIANHMDFVTYDEKGNQRYLETKCPGYGVFKQVKAKGLKSGWILQGQQGILVGKTQGFYGGAFAVHHVETWTMVYFDVDPDKELHEMILEKCVDFWRRIENGPEPEGFPNTEPRCRKCEYRWRCHGNVVDVSQMYLANPVPDPEIIGLVNEILEYQDIEDEAHAFTEEARVRLKTKIGPQCNFRVPGASVNNVSFDRNGWDTDALNAYMNSNPSIAKMFAKFRKKTSQSQLRIERI